MIQLCDLAVVLGRILRKRWRTICLLLVVAVLLNVPVARQAQARNQTATDLDNLMSDYVLTNLQDLSVEQIEQFLERLGVLGGHHLLLPWNESSQSIDEAILSTAREAEVNPKVVLVFLEMDLGLLTIPGMDAGQLVEYLQSMVGYFKGAYYEGAMHPYWSGPNRPTHLVDGATVYPANLATALFYGRYSSIQSAERFVELWKRFDFGDLHDGGEVVDLSLSSLQAQATADIFSFPLGSPGGNDNQVVQEFNVWYPYYAKWHAGEDWARNDLNSADTPVYAVANGQVVHRKDCCYPGGNLLIKHILADGSVVYSHYGHITPQVTVGTLVDRGQQIGLVHPWTEGAGLVNSHLHFEIRTVEYPGSLSWYGPGYFTDDPRNHGYLDATAFVVNHSFGLPVKVRVLDTSSLNVRSSPSTDAPVIATIARDQERTAIRRQIQARSPSSTEGSIWYQLRYDPNDLAKTGWSAGVYYDTTAMGLLGSYVYLAEIGKGSVGDITPPHNPTIIDAGFTLSLSGCSANGNNCWQNIENNPKFTWSGAWDEHSDIRGYYVYWGGNADGDPTIWTAGSSLDPGPAVEPDGIAIRYLRMITEDTAEPIHNRSVPQTLYVLRYDGSVPTVAISINDGLHTTNKINIRLVLSSSDTGSGVSEVCVSNNATSCTYWQPYADEILWTLPKLDRQTHTVHVWVRDWAGNVSQVASDDIYLDLYPAMPHSDNYRICQNVVDIAGSAGLASTNYGLTFAVGQPWATGAREGTAPNFQGWSGFLANMDGCLPITRTLTNDYRLTQSVVAAGGSLRSTASFRIGDTVGQPAASGAALANSTNYQLSSGFWSQSTEAVPVPSTPVPTTSTPTPTPTSIPTPTPTPQSGSFGVSINSGDLYTNDPAVSVHTWAPNITHVRLSNDGAYADQDWMPYQETTSWSLSTYGDYVMPRFVYAWFRDAGGDVYGPYMDEIVYDPTAPEGSVLAIGGDTGTFTLILDAYDDNSGVSEMRVSDTPIVTTASDIETAAVSWRAYESNVEWTPTGDSVYVQFRDRAGNTSPVYDVFLVAPDTNYRIYMPLVLR